MKHIITPANIIGGAMLCASGMILRDVYKIRYTENSIGSIPEHHRLQMHYDVFLDAYPLTEFFKRDLSLKYLKNQEYAKQFLDDPKTYLKKYKREIKTEELQEFLKSNKLEHKYQAYFLLPKSEFDKLPKQWFLENMFIRITQHVENISYEDAVDKLKQISYNKDVIFNERQFGEYFKNVEISKLSGHILPAESFNAYIEKNDTLVKYLRPDRIHFNIHYYPNVTRFHNHEPFYPFGTCTFGGMYFTLNTKECEKEYKKDNDTKIGVTVPPLHNVYVYFDSNNNNSTPKFKTNCVDFIYQY